MKRLVPFLLLCSLLLLGCGKGDTGGQPLDHSVTLMGKAGEQLISVTVRLTPSQPSGENRAYLAIEAASSSGTGTVFEATSQKTEWNQRQLLFTWIDSFGNRGKGVLSPVTHSPGDYRLILTAGELVEPRIARYLHEYSVRQKNISEPR